MCHLTETEPKSRVFANPDAVLIVAILYCSTTLTRALHTATIKSLFSDGRIQHNPSGNVERAL